MNTQQQLPVAVIGATGQQGRAVVDALLEAKVPVRALVRNPDASAAQALRARGVDLVAADQEDESSLAAALGGVASLFFMTTFAGPEGPAGETRRGFAVAEAAARAGVPRVVYSSVGGAERGTGVPHFESKREVELRLGELLPATFVRPTFFMENLGQQLEPGAGGETVIRLPMPGDVPLQMISVRDVGRAAARLILDPSAIVGEGVEIAGAELTLEQVAEQASSTLGRPVRFEPVPVEVLGEDEDLKAMFRWFTEVPAYRADLDATRALVPQISDFRSWLEGVMDAAAAGRRTA